ncbi:hypothetical protein XH88_29375 [Bradyrhizobium sp. CCBAU 51627]|nr:hypothetical protein [Bradyrhizobium sp. CCBAU 51627]
MFWRDTLADAAVSREWIVNVGLVAPCGKSASNSPAMISAEASSGSPRTVADQCGRLIRRERIDNGWGQKVAHGRSLQFKRASRRSVARRRKR